MSKLISATLNGGPLATPGAFQDLVQVVADDFWAGARAIEVVDADGDVWHAEFSVEEDEVVDDFPADDQAVMAQPLSSSGSRVTTKEIEYDEFSRIVKETVTESWQ